VESTISQLVIPSNRTFSGRCSWNPYVEVWLEKDALSGIFEDVLRPYGVTLNVGRGYGRVVFDR
jgi:hypothetical protein